MKSKRFALWQAARAPSFSMLLCLGALLVIGALFVHSASMAGEGYKPFWESSLARLHSIRIFAGLVFLFLMLRLDYRRLEQFAIPLYLASICLLLVLLGLKPFRSGPSRWLYLPGFAVQPSELIKVCAVLVLARYLNRARKTGGNPIVPFFLTGFPFVLVALQPDLGTALILPPILITMIWSAGFPTKKLILLFIAGLFCLPLGWYALKPYQKARIMVFVDTENSSYASGAAYQIKQSLWTIGSGGIQGKGLYEGSQNRLDFLPEEHNDFIFAIIGEEWGLIGTCGVILLFVFLYGSCFVVAYRTREFFGRFVVLGLTVQLSSQTVINLAMTTGMTPVTGLPLPFISYGGSSLFATLVAMGIILGIGMRPIRNTHPGSLSSGSAIRGR